jgi:hypothetical protein
MFRVFDRDGNLHEPKYQIGQILDGKKVTGITYYEGHGQFCYWLEGVGHDIPEDEFEA